MKQLHRMQARQSGFSLVELLVSMTLGLVMLGALVALFGTSLQTNSQNSTSAQMTEEGGLALEFLARYVRMAGFSPPLVNASGASVLVNGTQVRAVDSDFTGVGVRGCSGDFDSPLYPSNPRTEDLPLDLGNLVCNPGVKSRIAVRFQGDTSNTEPIANKPTDCLANAITDTVSSNFGTGQDITFVEAHFSINDKAELVCAGNGNNFSPQPLFSNIEDLRFSYGIAADGVSAQVLRYVDAATVEALPLNAAIVLNKEKSNLRWARVVSVKICMVVRASTPDQSQPQPYADCDEHTVTPTDKYLRRSISTVVTLRNRSAIIQ